MCSYLADGVVAAGQVGVDPEGGLEVVVALDGDLYGGPYGAYVAVREVLGVNLSVQGFLQLGRERDCQSSCLAANGVSGRRLLLLGVLDVLLGDPNLEDAAVVDVLVDDPIDGAGEDVTDPGDGQQDDRDHKPVVGLPGCW